MTGLYAAVGARDCGKTTTLAHLRIHYGYRVHAEAHYAVLAEIGTAVAGHPEHAPYQRIEAAGHFCPMCRPLEFCERVLARQQVIEAAALAGDWVDHGWLDAVEHACRRAGLPELPSSVRIPAFPPYSHVLLFAVMPELQRPRWGKNSVERGVEAEAMNAAIAALYTAHGMQVLVVPPATVAARAAFVHAAVSAALPRA